ncbi:hypothetical protein D9613_005148 [Agrocybe pediades]|uniref:Vacuolar ATPase assembly integral membrane protein VMA21 n=1 Tax=Agrocybe pediades TaxID=84607 RepID=A0A8H4QYS3_9AGAR|nr:hypothetical protein D9613_005148 [Agrocybe pediades]
MSDQAAIAKLNADTAASGVLAKLIVFSISLGVVPIGSYFLSLKYVWNENSTFAAITAVVAANVVLVAYIISSVLEDRQNAATQKQQPESKKNR